MRRSMKTALVAGLVAAVSWACGTASGLSSDQYMAQDLAQVRYQSMYEFLDAHMDVMVAESGGSVPLAVRTRGSGGMPSTEIVPEDTSSGGGGAALGGGGGGGAQMPGRRNVGGYANFAAAKLYIDGTEVADPRSELRNISPSEVESLEILRPTEASSRFGGSGDFGAVSIELKN